MPDWSAQLVTLPNPSTETPRCSAGAATAELLASNYNCLATAKKLGRSRETVTRALRTGWPALEFPPVTPSAQPEPAPAVPIEPASREQRAIDGALRNADGAGVALTKILNQLMLAAPAVLAKLSATGDDAITPREYMTFVKDVAKATESIAKANAHSVSTNRVASGVPNVQQVQHLHAHAVVSPAGGATGPAALSSIEADAQIDDLLDIHRRARAYAPGSYQGEETGIAPADDGADSEDSVVQ